MNYLFKGFINITEKTSFVHGMLLYVEIVPHVKHTLFSEELSSG